MMIKMGRLVRGAVALGAAGVLSAGYVTLAAAEALPAPQQAINVMESEGILARGAGARYGPDAVMNAGEVAGVLHRFDARTGRAGDFIGQVFRLPGAAVVTRSEGLVAILNATGLHRGTSAIAAVHTANRLGLLYGLPGMTAGPGQALLRGQLAVILLRIQQPGGVGAPVGVAGGPVGVPAPAAAAMVTGTITQVQATATGEVLTLSTASGAETVQVAATAQAFQSGQAVPLSQIAAGQAAELTLNPSGQAQSITLYPAGTAPVPATTVNGTLASFANGQIALQPSVAGGTSPTYAVSSSVVVTENGQGATTAALGAGDLVTLHILGGTVTWVALRASSSTLTGNLTSVVPGGYVLTEADGTTVRLAIPATAQVSAAGIVLPRGALAVGEAVDVAGLARTGAVVAQTVSITGDVVSGTA